MQDNQIHRCRSNPGRNCPDRYRASTTLVDKFDEFDSDLVIIELAWTAFSSRWISFPLPSPSPSGVLPSQFFPFPFPTLFNIVPQFFDDNILEY